MTKKEKKIYTGSACIGLFHRNKKDIVEAFKVELMELMGGKALLDAIVKFQFPEGEPDVTKKFQELLLKD